MGGGGVLGLACRRNSGPPGTAKLEEETRPRRAARLRAAVDDVGEDPARGGRRRAAGSGGGGGGERSEREGGKSKSKKIGLCRFFFSKCLPVWHYGRRRKLAWRVWGPRVNHLTRFRNSDGRSESLGTQVKLQDKFGNLWCILLEEK